MSAVSGFSRRKLGNGLLAASMGWISASTWCSRVMVLPFVGWRPCVIGLSVVWRVVVAVATWITVISLGIRIRGG